MFSVSLSVCIYQSLREDHLLTLRREVEARIASLSATANAKELRDTQFQLVNCRAELVGSHSAIEALQSELEHQKQTTAHALKAANSSSELAAVVSEMARFRGETSRLEVELSASNKRAELLVEQMNVMSDEIDALRERERELVTREESAAVKESAARKERLDIELKYSSGGLTSMEAEKLLNKLDKTQRDMQEALRDADRHKQLAEIASTQAASLAAIRQQYTDELKELREYCTMLESRSEDELIIGRLQRQLMSTKVSYKAFVRKYQVWAHVILFLSKSAVSSCVVGKVLRIVATVYRAPSRENYCTHMTVALTLSRVSLARTGSHAHS